MPDESGVHCHLQQGVVSLTCGEDVFARLVAAVVEAAGPAAVALTAVDVVVIKRAEPTPRPTPWLDLLGWIGCAAAASTVLLLLGTGAYTLSSWVWQP
jgi:hypothetical protein